ncbi:hypothetical protein OP862_15745 [Yersinia massiliensis]|uniref:hypothetical protein n=1 Tax=Yersinia massiliensis TaxID=419257 RepID=UPI002240844D|nr:hypothetical protein [Yersinia massiliensis]MDA5547580.1 hypothetical protein [Yersinia massiliensis]UZM77986.1 hypothetical protein OP862_15745 [Yersinia massiliensis]
MADETKTGGLAFPFNDIGGDCDPGMTLRDYFAAKAIAVAWSALAAGYFEADAESSADKMAICAYQLADAMIKVRG